LFSIPSSLSKSFKVEVLDLTLKLLTLAVEDVAAEEPVGMTKGESDLLRVEAVIDGLFCADADAEPDNNIESPDTCTLGKGFGDSRGGK
jgi:hypothetical protein